MESSDFKVANHFVFDIFIKATSGTTLKPMLIGLEMDSETPGSVASEQRFSTSFLDTIPVNEIDIRDGISAFISSFQNKADCDYSLVAFASPMIARKENAFGNIIKIDGLFVEIHSIDRNVTAFHQFKHFENGQMRPIFSELDFIRPTGFNDGHQ